jgi:hypothetical protein
MENGKWRMECRLLSGAMENGKGRMECRLLSGKWKKESGEWSASTLRFICEQSIFHFPFSALHSALPPFALSPDYYRLDAIL